MISCARNEDRFTVVLEGEIDHHAAIAIREELDRILKDQSINELLFDFKNVSFMDSSGIGMMIGRYKIMKSRNGRTCSTGLSKAVERVYRIGGLHRIIPIV